MTTTDYFTTQKSQIDSRPNINTALRPLIGRANQLERLDQQFSLVERGAFCISLLSGNRGIGKTAVVRHMVHRYHNDPIIYIEVELSAQNNQTDHLIQAIISESIVQLSNQYNNPEASNLLEKLLHMFRTEGLEWLFAHLFPEQYLQKTKQATASHNLNALPLAHPTHTKLTPNEMPRQIIRRDAFIALMKRAFTDSLYTLSCAGFKLICYVKNLEVADLSCLDFISEAFRKQLLSSFFLIYQTPIQNNRSLDYFSKELCTKDPTTQNRGQFKTIPIPPLSKTHTYDLIKHQLSPSTFNLSVLSNIIYDRSKGNPGKTLFILELLKELKLIYRSRVNGAWDAHLEKISREKTLSNHFDKTDQFIERSYCTKKVLIYAACYHEPFSSDILKAITPTALWPQIESTLDLSIKYKLILPHPTLEQHFVFKSENIVEQVLSLENANSLNIIYMKILTVLISHYPQKAPFQKPITAFQLAECINALMPIAIRYNDKVTYQALAINAAAGFRALSRNDISLAYRYFKVAKEPLDAQIWDQYHSLCYFIYFNWIRCLLLREEFGRCIHEIEQHNAPHFEHLEQAKISTIKIYCLKAIGNHKQAIAECRNTLKTFGIRIPKKPNALHILYQYLLSATLIKWNPDLAETGPKKVKGYRRELATIAHKLCEMMAHSGYIENTHLTYYSTMRIIELSKRFGATPHTTIAVHSFSLLYFFMYNNPQPLEKIYTYTQDTEDASSRYYLLSEMFYWGMQGPWRFPIRQCTERLYNRLKSLNNFGDDETGSHYSSFYFSFSMLHGQSLRVILQQITQLIPKITAPKYSSAYYCNLIYAQAAENAVYVNDSPTTLRGQWFDEHLYEEVMNNGDFLGKLGYYCATTYTHLAFGEYQKTVELYKKGKVHAKGLQGLFSILIFKFFGELGLVASLSERSSLIKKYTGLIRHTPRMLLSLIYFKKLASRQPSNFECPYLLLKGLTRNLLGLNRKKALKEINRSIGQARRLGYANFAALGYELKYKFILSKRRPYNIRPLRKAIEHCHLMQHNAKKLDLLRTIQAIQQNPDHPVNASPY